MACGHKLAETPAGAPSPRAVVSGIPATIPSAEPEHAGERRQATVLFSDLSGYTEMNEHLDPEEVQALVGRLKAGAVRIVETYGGIVNQFVGDEVLALFGVPTAHEDDPLRAVRAARELHRLAQDLSPEVEEKIGRPLRMHTGIDTGLIVTDMRDTRNGAYGITGDTVNTGARLRSLAPSGEILLSPETRRRVSTHYETTPLEPVALKGKGEPLVPYRLGDVYAAPMLQRKPLIGRSGEQHRCREAFQACLAAGAGRAVYLRGEPGIGKTHLVETLCAQAEALGFRTHTGLILDFGSGQDQDAVVAILRGMLRGVLSAPGAGSEALARGAISEGLLPEDREPYLYDLLGLPAPARWRGVFDAMNHEARNQGRLETLSSLVALAGGRGPHLLVVEDLHWADAVTLKRLEVIAAAAASVPVVVLMTTRIEGDPLDAGWYAATKATPMLTLDLAPLGEEDARAFASAFMDSGNRLVESCVQRAGGNPLFLEQLLRSAEETADEEVPGSVQSIVLARMDRLEPVDRRALQSASVLGQRFGLEALRNLTGIADLTCAGLIDSHLIRPEGEDFLFCHALIQEGVYSSLLKTRRRALHERAAAWYREREQSLYAEHLDRAEDPNAPRAYLEAAQPLAAEFRYPRALILAERGLLLAREPEDRFDLQCLRGSIFHDNGDTHASIEAYRAAVIDARDDAQRCRAWIGMAAGMRITDRYEEALEALDQAEVLAQRGGLSLEQARLCHLRGNIYFPMGDIKGCLTQHQQAMVHARSAGSHEYEAHALGGLGDGSYMLGRMKTAYDHFMRSVTLSREHGLIRIEASYLYMVGWTSLYLTDTRQSLELTMQATEIATQLGTKREQMVARVGVCRALLEQGQPEAALEHVLLGAREAEVLGANRFRPFFAIFHARALAALGEGTAVLEPVLQEALETSRSTGFEFVGPWLLSTLALHTQDAGLREDCLKEGAEALQNGCVGHNHLDFYPDAMEIALHTGEWDRVEHWARALEAFTREEPLPLPQFLIERARALAAHGAGNRDEGLLQRLRALHNQAQEAKLVFRGRALEGALAEYPA